jgi:hypothetical protein
MPGDAFEGMDCKGPLKCVYVDIFPRRGGEIENVS